MTKFYTVRDAVTGICGNFFSARNDDDAKRIVFNALGRHPFMKDMSLYRLPCLFDETICVALFDADDRTAPPAFVCNLVDLYDVAKASLSEVPNNEEE